MKERLLQFLKAENKTSAQLADEIGVQPSGISHILSGRNKPSLDFVIKMLEKYKFLSTEWLMFGKGDMYKEPEMQKLFDESLDFKFEKPQLVENNSSRAVNAAQPLPEEHDNERNKPEIDRIVWFFKDNSFKEYTPGR